VKTVEGWLSGCTDGRAVSTVKGSGSGGWGGLAVGGDE
jgi:hypothetical protein